MGAELARAIRAGRIVAGDPRIPRPVRWIAGLALLPVPGPLDEAVLVLIVALLVLLYREPVREAWARAQ